MLTINHTISPVFIKVLHIIVLVILLFQIHPTDDLHLIGGGLSLSQPCPLNAIDKLGVSAVCRWLVRNGWNWRRSCGILFKRRSSVSISRRQLDCEEKKISSNLIYQSSLENRLVRYLLVLFYKLLQYERFSCIHPRQSSFLCFFFLSESERADPSRRRLSKT